MKSKIDNSKKPNILGNRRCLSNEILTASLKRWWQKLGYFSMFTALPTILVSLVQQARAEETNITPTSDSGQNVKLLERLNRRGGKPKFLQYGNNFPVPFEKGQTNIISNLTGGDDCPGNPIPAGVYTAANPFTDSGDTTGANNTVGSAYCYYCNSSTAGPDQIYSFTLTGLGANPRIEVSATSGSYSPTIYILDSRYGPCPGGTNNAVFNNLADPARANSSGTAAYDTLNFLPLNVPLYLFIDAQNADSFGSYTLRMRDVSIALAPSPQRPFDFDGDGRADIGVFRPSDQTWWLNGSSQGVSAVRFGLPTDKIAPAHFDGDGKTDITLYRNGTWYRLNSHDNTVSVFQFGLPNDIPVPGNYYNDGRSELAVYRNGVWWIYITEYPYTFTVSFGLATDKPVPADYDGDGFTEPAVYRDGVWWILPSSSGGQFQAIQFGLATDKPVPADYDGDGKTDLAVYRGNGEWHILGSSQGYFVIQWGLATDIPVPADYDGDGKADAAVFRNGIWYLLQSTSGISIQQFGLPDDKPLPSAFLP